jgi:hypothetical protein
VKGIPVHVDGNPVRRTFVIAGNHTQFVGWCMRSEVNPRSRNVCYLYSAKHLRGSRDVDVVFTGSGEITPEIRWYLQVVGVHEWHYNREAYEIEPNVVEC